MGSAAAFLGAAELVHTASAETNSSFASVKQIEAGLLNVGYADIRSANGSAVVLLHGWPYDIHSYVDVAPQLAASGYRVIVPYSRGYGSTSFLSKGTFRNAQQAAVALDVVALIDALKIENAILGGLIGARGPRRLSRLAGVISCGSSPPLRTIFNKLRALLARVTR